MNIGKAYDKKLGNVREYLGEDEIKTKKRPNKNEKQWNTYSATKYDNSITKGYSKWEGWGTALKPSFEPIIVARKPLKGSLVDNILEYGVGGINIDECRVELNGDKKTTGGCKTRADNISHLKFRAGKVNKEDNSVGRFPANTILTYDETDKEEVIGGFPITKQNGSIKNPNLKNSLGNGGIYNKYSENQPMWEAYQDSGSASRYFYCAKASKKDRDEGLAGFKEYEVELVGQLPDGFVSSYGNVRNKPLPKRNIHPTVKPTELMQYLVRLVTPKGGTVLDPFNGSGSTGKAVAFENREREANYKYIGIELDKNYCEISKARIQWASNEYVYLNNEQVSKEQIEEVKKVNNKINGIRLW